MPDSLAKQFNAEGVQFSMQQNLLVLEVENRFATAKITNHGASVLSYVPKQGPSAEIDLLWVSDQAVFDGSKPVRGGIPVCWPWFGKAEDPELPAHGFVRNRVWQVEQVSNLENGVTEVVLSTHSDDASLAIWPHAFDLTLRVEIGEKLTMTLISHNPNAYDISITEAFHSYFNVADCREVEVVGLEGSRVLDKLTDADAFIQQGPVRIHPPIDNVYLEQAGEVSFADVSRNRRILVEKNNGRSTVVWNPGAEGVRAFQDIDDNAWQGMLCVEAGNVLDNAVVIPAESRHLFSMTLSAESL